MTQREGKIRTAAILALCAAAGVAMALSLAGAPYAQLAASPWPMFRHDTAHTGQSEVDTSANNGVPKWVFVFGENIFGSGSPTLGSDGTIYITPGDNNLYAFHPGGVPRWTFTASGPMIASPAIGADGTIYASSTGNFQEGFLYAVNPDGTLKWTFVTGFGVESSPALAPDGTIYIFCDDGKLYAINPDGSSKWVFATGLDGTNEEVSPAISPDGTIYFGCANYNFYAVNPDGTLKWLIPNVGDVVSSPAIAADGTIYVGSGTSGPAAGIAFLFAINPNGTIKWYFRTAHYWVQSSPAIAADGTVYFGDGASICAVNPDGSLKWEVFTQGFLSGGNGEVKSSPAIGADGSIYIGADDGNIYALNPDGSLKWRIYAGAEPGPNPGPALIHSSPAIGTDGTIYIIVYPYGPTRLYAIGHGTPTPTATPTPSGTMKLIPESIRFPEKGIGLGSESRVLTIKNSSRSQHLSGTIGTLSPPFQVGYPGYFDLPPHSELKDIIFFKPVSAGFAWQQLVIQSSDPENPTVNVIVSGTGADGHLSVSRSLLFPDTTIGSSAAKKLMLKNTGLGMLSGSVGSLASPFTVSAGGGSFGPLKPNATATVTITFHPRGQGTATPQTLSVSTNSPAAGIMNVTVSGAGN